MNPCCYDLIESAVMSEADKSPASIPNTNRLHELEKVCCLLDRAAAANDCDDVFVVCTPRAGGITIMFRFPIFEFQYSDGFIDAVKAASSFSFTYRDDSVVLAVDFSGVFHE